jgi:Tol biopolymer transport system component
MSRTWTPAPPRLLLAATLLAAAAAAQAPGTGVITQAAVAPVAGAVVVATQEGTAKTGQLVATDADGDALSFSIVTPPSKGTIEITNIATGAFTFAPNAGALGYDTFTFRATDSTGASSDAPGFVFIVVSSPRWPGQTTRVSLKTDGTQQTNPSTLGAVPSADGRFIAFTFSSFNEEMNMLVVNVYVHDRQSGQITLVSKGNDGVMVGGALPSMTPDGRYVGFTTLASTFPGGHPDASFDALVHDRQTGLTERIGVASNGTPGNAENVFPVLSADGRFAAFYGTSTNLVPGDTDDREDVFLRNRQTGQTGLVSVSTAGVKGNGDSWFPTMSADGRFIAFNSEATNLVAGDTNGRIDVFVRDLQTGQTTRVSVGTGGTQSNGSTQGFLSAEGRFVALSSGASNLVSGDTNGFGDVFVHDRQTGQTTRVSVSSAGAEGNGDSEDASVSADGRYVAFRSAASNLVPGDTNGVVDEFVHDRVTGRTVRVNVASDGSQANAASTGDDDGCCITPVISADGRSVVISSLASNLVAGDTNNVDDVFVVGPVSVGPTTFSLPEAGGTRTVNVAFDYPGTPWTATTTAPWITINPPTGGSANGTVSFTVAANNGLARTGTITAALQTITVAQDATALPQPPTGLVASSIAGNGITLRFTPPVGGPAPTGYLLEGGVNPGETLASLPTGSTAPIYSLTAPNGAFYLRMRTVTAAGTSGPSNEIRVFVNTPQAPSAPTNLLATVNGSTLALTWKNTAAGGAPTSILLEATGAVSASLPLPLGESFSYSGVPNGTYTLAVRAVNATGTSGPSNTVTVTIPTACSGAPLAPINFLVVKSGSSVSLFWDPAATGPAPTSYVVHVAGSFTGQFPGTARSLTATAPPGTFNLSVTAANACGTSAPTAVQTVTVP